MRLAILLLALAALVAGCGAPSDSSKPDAALDTARAEPAPVALASPRLDVRIGRSTRPEVEERCAPGTERPLRSDGEAYAAIAVAPTGSYAHPGGRRTHTFRLENANGYITVFGVLAEVVDESCRASWYRVQLPVKPNGSTGYVPADTVELELVRTRIEVDLSERRLELFEDGKPIMRLAAAVGAPETPTPMGRFYVNQRFRITDSWGPFGPAALGINAFSDVLQEWSQGGPIAIHGTNAPDSVG